jgi:hypothetical protein
MLHKLNDAAKNNGQKVILAVFDDPRTLNDKYVATQQTTRNGAKWFCADASEWDASFHPSMVEMFDELLKMMGCNEWMRSWFKHFRSHWKTIAHTKNGNITYQGSGKQFSGSPFTICENTIANLSLINLMFDFRDTDVQLAIGDDTAIQCQSYIPTKEGTDFIRMSGHNYKQHFDYVGEFAGYILTPEGLACDPVRRTCKFLGAAYLSEAHFNEARKGVVDSVSTIKNPAQQRAASYAASQMYPQLTPGQASILYDFLRGAERIRFSELTATNRPVISD